MLKIVREEHLNLDDVSDEMKKLVPFFKEMCHTICDGLWENIHSRDKTTPAEDIGAMFDFLISITASAMGSAPGINLLSNDQKLTVNTRKEILQVALNEYTNKLNHSLKNALIDTITDKTIH